VERTPLLALQLKLYKVREDGTQVETNPRSQFYAGDRLRLGVVANQDGFLTIIHQRGGGQDGEVLFPTSLANDGRNDVNKNRESVVPSNCPVKDDRDCAYVLQEPAGTELFTIIFSRDIITTLPEKSFTPSGSIKADTIREIEIDSVNQLRLARGLSAFSVLVVNEDRLDNEEVFLRFPIINKGKSSLSSRGR
jgi:hypothetical protein